MALFLQNIAFDCADAYAVGSFWSEVTGLPLNAEDKPGEPAACIEREGGNLYFENVPESKTVKNRVHVCLQAGRDRDAEYERILGLGAVLVADHRREDGGGWVVLADPEGNEFCVLGRRAD